MIEEEEDLNLSQIMRDDSRKQIICNQEFDFKATVEPFAITILLDTSDPFESIRSQYDRVFNAKLDLIQRPQMHLYSGDYL